MLFWIVTLFLILLVIVSAVLTTMAYRRQQQVRMVRAKLRQLRQRTDEHTEIRNTLLKTDPTYELLTLIQALIVKDIEASLALAPENKHLKEELDQEQLLLTQFEQGTRKEPANPALASDNDIDTANIRLNSLMRVLARLKKKGKISVAKTKEYVQHIQKLRLDIEVESHVKQANRYLKNNDRVLAQSHLKQAKEALRSSPIEFPEKRERISEISDQIKNLMSTVIDRKPDNEAPEEASTTSADEAEKNVNTP